MRAPAAAEASRRSWALDTERPTTTTRPTRPAGTARGEPATTPSSAPAPDERAVDSGAPFEQEDRHAPRDPGQRGPLAHEAPFFGRLPRLGPQAEELAVPRLEIALQAFVLRARREELAGRLDGSRDALRNRGHGRGQRRGERQDPGLEHRASAAASRRLRREDQDAHDEDGDEHDSPAARVDRGDLDVGVLDSHAGHGRPAGRTKAGVEPGMRLPASCLPPPASAPVHGMLIFLKRSMSVSIAPVPSATDARGSSA